MSLYRRRLMMQYADDARYIHFEDSAVEQWCLANFDKDGDGRISIDEAAAVTDAQFKAANPPWETFTTFDEMLYFTALQNIGDINWRADSYNNPNNNLRSISLNDFIRGNIAAQHINIDGRLRAERFYAKSLHLGPNSVINTVPWNYNNNWLEEVTISKANRNNRIAKNFILSYDGTIAYQSFGKEVDVVVPDGVKKLVSWSVLSKEMRTLVVPDSVEDLDGMFSNAGWIWCDIGAGVKKTGHSFLYNSYRLKYIILRGRLPEDPQLRLKHKFDIYVQAGDIDYYKALLPAPYNTYLKPISELP